MSKSADMVGTGVDPANQTWDLPAVDLTQGKTLKGRKQCSTPFLNDLIWKRGKKSYGHIIEGAQGGEQKEQMPKRVFISGFNNFEGRYLIAWRNSGRENHIHKGRVLDRNKVESNRTQPSEAGQSSQPISVETQVTDRQIGQIFADAKHLVETTVYR